MPRDILNLSFLRLSENDDEDYVPLDESTKSKSLHQTTQNPDDDHPGFEVNRAGYNNYGIKESNGRGCNSHYQLKTKSLPGTVSIPQTWDDVPCSVLDVSPEDIASQLTLLDEQCFKAIRPEELTTCGWTKPNKQTISPNVVAFTKRFNRVIFWTVQEILNVNTPKARAEVMVHFIKVGKKLHDLNNIHSLFAIVSALRSASIFRLSQTWACVTKKDKQTYDKLADIFNEDDNWSALRSYLSSLSLPCIPYLGLFLTDLVFISLVHPIGSPNRMAKMEVVLKVLERYQTSEYNITPLPKVTTYLSSVRYIEELLILVEKDQFKLSQKLEGPSPNHSGSSSKESVKESYHDSSTPFSLSPSHRSVSSSFRCHGNVHPAKFHPTHRKCRSLGTNVFCHTKTQLENGSDRSTPVMSLLDDTLMEFPTPDGRMSVSLESGSISKQMTYGHQGQVKRKTIYKNGKKSTLSSWQRYWLQIYNRSLFYFLPKTFKSLSRSEYRSEPCKVVPLEGWSVGISDDNTKDTFQLVNHQTHTIYKFKTASVELARDWIMKIQEITNDTAKPLPDNLLLFE